MAPENGAAKKMRVAIVFAGGPAPAANSVIGAAAAAFLENGHEAIGFFHGYSNLQEYNKDTFQLVADKHYRLFTEKDLRGLRNSRGIVIGTARANPGKMITTASDLQDETKTEKLRNVYNAITDMEIDALISIGGDDTLKTANLVLSFQKYLPEDAKRFRVIHLPKTIDNDYRGIDFTFGFFTAVDIMAKEVLNLRADALATSAYYIIETMGRKAGWLSYGVAIAGEANLVLSVEDVDHMADQLKTGDHLDLNKLSDYIIDLILTREEETDKHYGTIVLAEGLAEMLPPDALKSTSVDEHGHIALGKLDLGKMLATHVSSRFADRTGGRQKKITGVQLGYEARCGPPHAFDVMLGSQLGVGAYRALVEDDKNAVLVSCGGQLDVNYVEFGDLINSKTLRAEVRFVEPESDFHRLARFMETRVDREKIPIPSARKEPGTSA